MDAVIESNVVEALETGPGRSRDRELVRYVGRHGVVRIGHVMAAMGAGRTVTYDRVAACVEAGLLERLELVRSEPGLLRATRDGLRYAGLGLPVAVDLAGRRRPLAALRHDRAAARQALRPRARPHRARARLGRADRGAPDRQRQGRRTPQRHVRACTAPTSRSSPSAARSRSRSS